MGIDINFVAGGEAGQGVQSVGFLLAKVFAEGGYHVFADQDYESRIRGGHNFFRVRVKDSPVGTVAEPINFLIALNKETIDLHLKEMVPGGTIIYDGERIKTEAADNLFSVPINRLAETEAGNRVMSNTVALGAALGMVGFPLDIMDKVIHKRFHGTVGDANIKAAHSGYDFARNNYKGKFSFSITPLSHEPMLLLTGNDAVSLGAIAAGCKFFAGYPMTPSTPILEYMVSKAKELGIAVVQPEDEIAACIMAVGASYAGVRAMTATSGSGFCLMVEGIGLAAMTETPIVIVDGQRPGPAIGLPTRTEQGDLQMVLHANFGDFPRVVMAPLDITDGFNVAFKAFNMAEKYQTPAVILTDHYYATAYMTVTPYDVAGLKIDRGLLYDGDGQEEYKRYKVTDSGISPRAFPGKEGALVVADSDEHDETGHLTESAEFRAAQVSKRLRKFSKVESDLNRISRYGPENAGTLLVGWGSTYGALCEAVDILRNQQEDVAAIGLNELSPFPAKQVMSAFDSARRTVLVESNATGQLAQLIRTETGKVFDEKILKWDGRPITPNYIVQGLKKESKA